MKKALANGISANQVRNPSMPHEINSLTCFDSMQIISYIMTHSHPQMRKNVRCTRFSRKRSTHHVADIQNPIIPVTVQDQIRLWEMEKHRVKSEEGRSPHSPQRSVHSLMSPLDRLSLQRLFLCWRLRGCPQVCAGSWCCTVVQWRQTDVLRGRQWEDSDPAVY